MYIINRIPHGKCSVRYLRTRCFCIRNLSRSLRSLFDFWYVNNSCVNTVRQHFPWSILYVLFLLYLRVKAQQYFVSLSYMFLDKKTVLKIWTNPGLNLRGIGPGSDYIKRSTDWAKSSPDGAVLLCGSSVQFALHTCAVVLKVRNAMNGI